MICNCSRYRLDQLNVNYTYSFTFGDCNCSVDPEIIVLSCREVCRPYNLSGFAGSYFSSICHNCRVLNKDMICIHCKRLRFTLNCETMKVCLRKGDLPKEFNFLEIYKFLEKYLKADAIFYFSKEENEIKLSIDSLD